MDNEVKNEKVRHSFPLAVLFWIFSVVYTIVLGIFCGLTYCSGWLYIIGLVCQMITMCISFFVLPFISIGFHIASAISWKENNVNLYILKAILSCILNIAFIFGVTILLLMFNDVAAY